MTLLDDLKAVKARVDLRSVVDGGVYGPDEYVKVFCPFHHDGKTPNLVVWADHFWCFACAARGDIHDWLRHTRGYSLRQTIEFCEEWAGNSPTPVESQDETLEPIDPEYVDILHKRLLLTVEPMLYLERRGIHEATVKERRLGYTGSAFVIPVFAEDGETCLTLRFRRDDKVSTDGSRYFGLRGRNKVLLYNAHLLKGAESAILCEGEFDSILATQEIGPACTFTNGKGAYSPAYNELFKNLEYLYFAFDQDAASAMRPLEISEHFKGLGPELRLVRWPRSKGKDCTDLIVSHGVGAFKEALERSLVIRS